MRSRSMMGFRTPFVPGWDCHGMPIEFKVSRDLGEKARTMPKLELRRLCRVEAEKWIDLQRKDFMRLGCIGDWFQSVHHDGSGVRRGRNRRAAQPGRARLRLSRPAPGALVLRSIAPRWPRPKSNIASTSRPRFTSRSRSTRNSRDAAALAAERRRRRRTRRRAQGGQALRRNLDDHAVDAAGQPRNQPQRDVRLRRAQGQATITTSSPRAWPTRSRRNAGSRSKNASRSIARRSRRSTARISSAIRLSRATSS